MGTRSEIIRSTKWLSGAHGRAKEVATILKASQVDARLADDANLLAQRIDIRIDSLKAELEAMDAPDEEG